jgi:hypothetical protein
MHGAAVGAAREFEVIEKHERLHQLAEIAGAHEPRDGTVAVPLGAVHDAALRFDSDGLVRPHDRLSVDPAWVVD